MSAARHLDAAVVEAGDPAAATVARVVPAGAKIHKFAEAVIGYEHEAVRLRHKPAFARVRLSEIERLIERRHGGPALTDDAVLYLEIAAPLIVALPSRAPASERVARWVRTFTPSVPEHEVAALIAAAPDAPKLTAEQAACALAVTIAERTALRFRTIGAVDMAEADRKARAREEKRRRDRERAAAKRRAAGSEPRCLYEGRGVSNTAATMGLSRWQLMRRLRKNGVAGPHKSVANKEHPLFIRDAPVRGVRDHEETTE